MATARRKLVSPDVTHWYHCITTCARGAPSLSSDEAASFIEQRLKDLSEIFTITVIGHKVFDRRLHLLVTINPEEAEKLKPDQIAKRWGKLVPPRDKMRQVVPVTKAWVADFVADPERVEEIRARLWDIGVFMKWLKEPLSRSLNKLRGERGTMFEARFKSIAVLDDPAILATCRYLEIDPKKTGIPAVRRNAKGVAEQTESLLSLLENATDARYQLKCFAADVELLRAAAATLGNGVMVRKLIVDPTKKGTKRKK